MKMATGDGLPHRQGAGKGLDWVLVAMEASGGGTPDLGFFLEVLGYIRGVGVGNKAGGSPGCPRGREACPGGWVSPPPSWAAQDSSGPTLLFRGLLLVQKRSP